MIFLELCANNNRAPHNASWIEASSLVEENPHAATGIALPEKNVRKLHFADAVLLHFAPNSVLDAALWTCAQTVPCVLCLTADEWPTLATQENLSSADFFAHLQAKFLQLNRWDAEFEQLNRLAAWVGLSLGVVWNDKPCLSPEQLKEWQQAWRVQQQSTRAAQQLSSWLQGLLPQRLASSLGAY